MTVTELLAQFANPEVIKTLPLADKMNAGLITTVLGMGITFTALIALLFMMSWMDKILNPKAKKVQDTSPATEVKPIVEEPANPENNLADDKELVAAITTVLAVSMKTSVSNIVVKNIRKIDDSSPAWNRAGIVEQMNSRL